MTTCTVCGRQLKCPKWFQGKAYGSQHFREVAGEALRRGRRSAGMGRIGRRGELPLRRGELPPDVDPRQTDLFAEDLAYANRVDVLLSSISLEMPR
jgi:hypothetical protein